MLMLAASSDGGVDDSCLLGVDDGCLGRALMMAVDLFGVDDGCLLGVDNNNYSTNVSTILLSMLFAINLRPELIGAAQGGDSIFPKGYH